MNITESFTSERDRALLGGDYANYHAQATRKIHSLRKKLGAATPRGRKYTPKSPITAEDVAQNALWIQLLLANAERAWANAMEMKSLQSPENTQRPMLGSTKRQIVSRHRRAIAYARSLMEVLSNTDLQSGHPDALEAKAYLALLMGGLDFEKAHWTSCLQNYATARLIYIALNKSTQKDIYRELLANTVDPSIKYAAYQSKLPRTSAVSDIAIERFPKSDLATRSEIEKLDSQAFLTTSKKTSSAQSNIPSNLPTTITWRSRKVNIEDGSVSQALGMAQDKEDNLVNILNGSVEGQKGTKELAAAYEEVINARQDAVDVTKTAIDELRSQGVDQGDIRIQSLQVTRTAVNYAVIAWRIGRNRILCGPDDGLTFQAESSKRHPKSRRDVNPQKIKEESSGRKLARLRERVALYDSILQSLDAIKELPGVAADIELVKQVDDKKAYFRSLKCLSIGRSCSIRGSITNALGLFSLASDLAKEISPSSSSANTTDIPIQLDIAAKQLKTVQIHLLGLTTQYRALAELKELNDTQKVSERSQVPALCERFHLRQYHAEVDLKNLVNYPAKLQPIPVKPLFFDLAWNYIQYPGQSRSGAERVVEKALEVDPEDKPAKRGWFGFGR